MCKFFYSIAIANLISIRVESSSLKGTKWHYMYEQIVIDEFARGFDFELTNIPKNDGLDFAWIKAPSPDEAKRIKSSKIVFSNEFTDVSFASRKKMSEDDKTRKNVIGLIAKNFNKSKSTIVFYEDIKAYMRERNGWNVFSLWE